MISLSRFDRHARLMNGMADALGVDLETEMMSGRMPPETYREKLFRCVGCRDAAACEKLLETAQGFLEGAPDYCRNRAQFDALSR